MRAFVVKILLDKLVVKNWDMWKREDKEFIDKCLKDNHCEIRHSVDVGCMDVKGSPEQLYHFMYDVAYRYDIELI